MTAWSRAPLPIALDHNMREKYTFIVSSHSDLRVDYSSS